MQPRWNGDWLDRMYNARAAVPQHPWHLGRWALASQDAREAHPCELDVAYGDDASERLDVFPADRPGGPAVVFIHGGYWRALDKADHSFLAVPLRNAGACVFVPNYALCPAVTIPDIVLQMVRALAWVHRHGARWGADARRLVVIGHSAGAHLAAMMLACRWTAWDATLPAQLVRGALGISGLYDLEPLMHAPFIRDTLRLTPDDVARASPAWLPPPRHGRMLAVVGAEESAEFQRQTTTLRRVWGERRVPVCETLPDCNHFSVLEQLSLPGTRLHQLALALTFGARVPRGQPAVGAPRVTSTGAHRRC
ncbi:MAG: alpha/beta hydrolase [Tepidimonas ignava]|uniref:alpha/beta hydrolase n=1 Tax=Tepidimonas ignava TaxID=114249 RepID=UPI00391DC7DB